MPVQIAVRFDNYGLNLFGIPCQNSSIFPDLGFIFDDYEFRIKPDNWIEMLMVDNTQYCFMKFRGTLHPQNDPPVILGIPFLQSYYF